MARLHASLFQSTIGPVNWPKTLPAAPTKATSVLGSWCWPNTQSAALRVVSSIRPPSGTDPKATQGLHNQVMVVALRFLTPPYDLRCGGESSRHHLTICNTRIAMMWGESRAADKLPSALQS
ncbi:hypothetical protein Fot_28811 [Forsythia ovata]|uniref:Uncharacterized protein n=1 Tax=Forsythia ovata TaxID=205694 RepID=A0ABD1TQ35_9LAMI